MPREFRFALARYTTAGILDGTFGSGGKVTTKFDGKDPSWHSSSRAMVRSSQPAARTQALMTIPTLLWRDIHHLRHARYDFGSGGKVKTDFHGQYDECHALGIESDGKIVAAGDRF